MQSATYLNIAGDIDNALKAIDSKDFPGAEKFVFDAVYLLSHGTFPGGKADESLSTHVNSAHKYLAGADSRKYFLARESLVFAQKRINHLNA